MVKTNIDVIQSDGAKRKNGHKLDCTCHICENIKNKAKRGGYEEDMKKEMEKKNGGSKKVNGHKSDCNCPICKNMKNARKNKQNGGNEKDNKQEEKNLIEKPQEEDNEENGDSSQIAGKKRSNGHKSNCNCPICKNMRKSKKGGEKSNKDDKIKEEIGEVIVDDVETPNVDYDSSENNNMESEISGGKKKNLKKSKTRKNKSKGKSRKSRKNKK